jgi:exodeoxyribonuclease-3
MFSKDIYSYFKCAEKKGYSGVSIHTREKPDKVIYQYGDKEFDNEGRYIEAQFGDLSIVSLYAPSGSSGEIRQEAKFRFLKSFKKHLIKILKSNRKFIICGDWNIAHKEIDLKNWKGNKKNSGFLPEEREWLDDLFDNDKYIDGFRLLNKKKDEYTWWSNRGNARENNVGWRIDYQIISGNLKNKIQKEKIYREKFFSDHAPLIFTYKI